MMDMRGATSLIETRWQLAGPLTETDHTVQRHTQSSIVVSLSVCAHVAIPQFHGELRDSFGIHFRKNINLFG